MIQQNVVPTVVEFVDCAGEQGAKDEGEWRLEGKGNVVAEGDVLSFRFSVQVL